MKPIFQLPAILIPISILLLHLLAGGTGADFHAHDTMFVMPSWFFLLPVYSILFLSFIVHVILCRKGLLPPKWAWRHIIATLLPFVLLVFLASIMHTVSPFPRRYYSFSQFNGFQTWHYVAMGVMVICAAGVLAQISLWLYAVVVLLKPGKPQV